MFFCCSSSIFCLLSCETVYRRLDGGDQFAFPGSRKRGDVCAALADTGRHITGEVRPAVDIGKRSLAVGEDNIKHLLRLFVLDALEIESHIEVVTSVSAIVSPAVTVVSLTASFPEPPPHDARTDNITAKSIRMEANLVFFIPNLREDNKRVLSYFIIHYRKNKYKYINQKFYNNLTTI